MDPVPGTPSAAVNRVIADPAVVESSGLAISPEHDGVLWTMNDSGNAPVLFAVGPGGATRARLRLSGGSALDWEAMAAWRGPSGRALLAAADIGDNAAVRSRIEIDVVAEPIRLASATVRPLRRIRLRYPGGRGADAETLLVDQRTQRMYIVTKGLLQSRIYAVPREAWPGTASDADTDAPTATLELLGTVGLQLATDGAVLPDGRVLLRSYTAVMLLAPLETGVRPLAGAALPYQQQGEGLAATSTRLYLSSEGRGSAILELAMPAELSAAEAPSSVTPAAAGSATASAAGPTGSGAPAAGSPSGGTTSNGVVASPVRVLSGLGVLGLGVCVALVLVRRRGGPGRRRGVR